MNSISAPRPTSIAMAPFSIESAPSSALIENSSITVRSTGSAPERSEIARALAVSTVKLPEICATPPSIGWRMLGAEITWPSRMMANGLPTFSRVRMPKRRPPAGSNVIWTIGSLVCESKLCSALVSESPRMPPSRFTAIEVPS